MSPEGWEAYAEVLRHLPGARLPKQIVVYIMSPVSKAALTRERDHA